MHFLVTAAYHTWPQTLGAFLGRYFLLFISFVLTRNCYCLRDKQVCSGLTYTFSIYSEHLKGLLHYTQEETNKLGAAKDFGSILGLLSGFLYSFYPPWVTVCIGALFHLIGYSMVRTLPPTPLLCPPTSWLKATITSELLQKANILIFVLSYGQISEHILNTARLWWS